jgi:phosphoadenosine phosphosulfate reductase
LQRKLAGKKAWVTGLRAAQSTTREALRTIAHDAANDLVKFSPLADWSEREVWAYLRHHGVPYNALHDQHFPSIGCAPCTRAIQPGEDIRAGRWWWESPETKECGLHVVDGKLQRVKGGQNLSAGETPHEVSPPERVGLGVGGQKVGAGDTAEVRQAEAV